MDNRKGNLNFRHTKNQKQVLSIWILMCLISCAVSSGLKLKGQFEVANGKNVTLTCTANGSLRFTFTDLSNVKTAIGQCSAFNDCYLFDGSLRGQYEIALTNTGATLTILNIDSNRFGNYTCSASFNASLSHSVMIYEKQSETLHISNTCTTYCVCHTMFLLLLVLCFMM